MLRTAARVARLSLGLWSPSLVTAISAEQGFAEGFGIKPRALSWLDRWELRNHRRDCERRGHDPLAASAVSAAAAWGAAMFRDDDEPPVDS